MNLSTFIGTIDQLAFTKSNDDDDAAATAALFVRICKKRVLKTTSTSEEGTSPTADGEAVSSTVTKLGVGIEGGFQSDQDKYETISTYSIVVMGKGAGVIVELPYDESTKESFPMAVSQSADSIIHHAGLAVQQDLKAWELDEEPKPVSKYAEGLPFVDNGVKVSPNPGDWKVRECMQCFCFILCFASFAKF